MPALSFLPSRSFASPSEALKMLHISGRLIMFAACGVARASTRTSTSNTVTVSQYIYLIVFDYDLKVSMLPRTVLSWAASWRLHARLVQVRVMTTYTRCLLSTGCKCLITTIKCPLFCRLSYHKIVRTHQVRSNSLPSTPYSVHCCGKSLQYQP